ncbi:hypothetical protein NL539_13950, partial [Aeromonas sp. CPF2-S1]|nr:hypothetical protein [Aeromonas sp. CPF2-S1]
FDSQYALWQGGITTGDKNAGRRAATHVLMSGLLKRSKPVCDFAGKSLQSALFPLIVSQSWTIKLPWMPFTPGDG